MRLLKIILPLLKINQKDILCYCGLVAKLCPTLRPCQASLFFTISQSLFKLKSIELMMPSNRLILSPPSPFALRLPNIRAFSHKSALHISWPKYWSFSSSPSNEYSKLISFRIDWFDLLAIQAAIDTS